MKNTFTRCCILSVLFLVVAGSFSPINALPVGRSNLSREYLVSPQDLGSWSIGLYAIKQERDVTANKYMSDVPMKSSKTLGYIGYDIIPWITAYVVGGSSETRIGWGSGSSKPEIGFGAVFNLIDTEIEDPTLFENRLRLSSHAQYTWGSAKSSTSSSDVKWGEFSGSLLLSIVNDLEGDKFFVPNSIALFVGPVFSVINSNTIEQDKIFGMTGGLDIFLNEKVSLELAYTRYEAGTYSIGVNVRF